MPDMWIDVDTELSEVPVNFMPIVVAAGTTIDDGVTYDEAGMDLNWNFITTAGAYSQTNVVPTTGGAHDWASLGNGMYSIEIPASGGTINNDTEGFGWFTGFCTACLPWRGPIIGFRAAALNNALVDGATVDVNVTAMGANVITATAINADAITAAKVAADVHAEGADAFWDELTSGHTGAGSMGLALGSLYSTVVVRVAQCGDAGSATTIDLDASASAETDFYKGQLIAIVLGTGAGQARTCTSYAGDTKIATVTPSWATNPDGDSYFAILNTGSTVVVDWADGGRLDLILDTIAADTTTDIPAKLLKYIQLLARSDAAIETDNATELTAINADGGSGAGNFSAQTDSGEAIRDHIGNGTNLTEAGGDGDHLTEVAPADGALTAAKFGADCITAAKVAADVHTENATAVWLKENATLSKAYGLIEEQIYQFLMNDMTITDATGAVKLRNLANDGDAASWGITDDDTTTTRTDVVWA